MWSDGWEDYLEGRERIDLIIKAQPQWMNVNVSGTGRLDEFFDHTGKNNQRLVHARPRDGDLIGIINFLRFLGESHSQMGQEIVSQLPIALSFAAI